MTRRKRITIVIPVYNEEKGIAELTKRIKKFIDSERSYVFEVIFVENGSSDTSFSLLKKSVVKEKRFKVIQLVKNVGCDGGILAGLRYATGEACIIVMADLQEPLDVARSFLEKWEEGYEIVYGVVEKRTASILRNLSSILFYKVINVLTGDMFPENASDFRLIDKQVYKVINDIPEHNKYLRGLVIWTGFRHIGIPFQREKRFAGESKADFRTVLSVAMNGIFSFSYLPLRFVSFLGILISSITFFLILFYLALFFIHGRETPGVTTIILLILFLFGVLFFVLGVISEYLARIYDEVKGRPHFVVRQKINL